MKKSILSNENGITLVELLVVLAITGCLSILIYNNLISGMNSYKSINKQITLDDEANYVMTRYENIIFEATDVQGPTSSDENNPCSFLIDVTKSNEDGMILDDSKLSFGLYKGSYKAMINGDSILSDPFTIVCTDSVRPSFIVDNNSVTINMTIQDNDSGRQLELNNTVSFVHVNQEKEGAE